MTNSKPNPAEAQERENPWRAYAEHLECCRSCAIDAEQCDEGYALNQAARASRAPAAASGEAAGLRELLRRSMGYVKEASVRYYDGTDGASMRASAGSLLKQAEDALAKANPAAGAEPVVEALKNYRCTHFCDEDGGLPLADALAAAFGDKDVGRALEEIEMIADHLAPPATSERDAATGFTIDPPGETIRCLRWAEGGVRPASEVECALWDRATSERDAEDARRLDHLQASGATVEILPVVFGGTSAPWRFRVGGLYAATHANLRTAIDAHRKEGGKP